MGKAKEGGSPPQTTSAEARRDALLDAEAKESQTLTLIAKQLRAARKKVKRAEEIEAIKAGGKEINADQAEAIRTKGKSLASIEVLERLFPLIKETVAAEINEKIGLKTTEIELKAKEVASIEIAEQAKTMAEANEIEKGKAAALAEDLKLKAEEALADKQNFEAHQAQMKADHDSKIAELQSSGKASTELAIDRILKLFYFSRLFSKDGSPSDYVPVSERNACLSYDQSLLPLEEALTERDLEDICALGKQISSRPPSDIISHEKALQRCIALANDWVNGEETLLPNSNAMVRDLVTKFERILASDYYTVQPREVAPEPKQAHSQPTSFQPENNASTQTARSGHLNGHFNMANSFSGPLPHVTGGNPGQNGHLLPQFLGSRPGQVPHERQLPEGAISFLPPLTSSSLSQQPSGSLGPNSQTNFPSFNSSANHQPPGFEVNRQKSGALPDNNNNAPGIQFNNQSYQGAQFGGIGDSELTKANPQFSGPAQGHIAPASVQPSFTPLHDNVPANTIQQLSNGNTAETKSHTEPAPIGSHPEHNEQGSIENKNGAPVNGSVRQPRASSEQYRGRGPPRGRGGRGGDFVPRGGGPGRRGSYNPSRGHRGGRGGRDYSAPAGNMTAAY